MSSLVLEDSLPFVGKILRESSTDETMMVSGIYQLGGIQNRNRRTYPDALWERILADNSDFRSRLSNRRVLGELAHPANGKTDYTRVSHLITEVWYDRNPNEECEVCQKAGSTPHLHIMAKEEVLDTPHGQILKELYRRNIQVGTSSRGSGSLSKGANGQFTVSDDYQLSTWDHVTDPSTQGCWPRVVNESVVDVVGKLADPVCDVPALISYKDVLSNVLISEGDSGSNISKHAQDLIVAIEEKLESPSCKLSATSVTVPDNINYSNPTLSQDLSVVEVSHCTCESVSDEKVTPSEEIAEDTNMSGNYSLDSAEVINLVNKEVQQVREQADAELAKAMSSLDTLTQDYEGLQETVAAHVVAGEELTSQLKEADIKIKAYESWIGENSTKDDSEYQSEPDELQEKFDLSCQVIDELVERLRRYKVFEKRSEAATKLLGETIARVRRKELVNHVDTLMAMESQDFSERVRPSLVTCESITDVNKMYGTLKSVVAESTVTESAIEQPVVHQEQVSKPLTEGALPEAGTVEESELINASSLPKTEVDDAVNEQLDLARKLTRALSHRAA